MDTRTLRRLADIADALPEGAVLVIGETWERTPTCEECGGYLEAGHCYRCRPVWGYSGG